MELKKLKLMRRKMLDALIAEALNERLAILEAKFMEFEETWLDSKYGPVQIAPEGENLK